MSSNCSVLLISYCESIMSFAAILISVLRFNVSLLETIIENRTNSHAINVSLVTWEVEILSAATHGA